MSCTRFRLLSLAFLTTASVFILTQSTSAALLSHFTFDSDYTNAIAGRDATGVVGATIDNSDYAVGGGSVRFDGGSTGEYVIAGTNAVPGIQGGYYEATVAFWFKADSALQPVGSNGLPYWGGRNFMGQANGDPASFGADNRMAFDIESDGSGKLRAFIRSADGTESNNRLRFSHDSTDPDEYLKWADGDWHHIALGWEVGSAGVVAHKLWLNGMLLPTVTQENTLETDIVKAPLTPWEDPGMFIGALNNRTFQGGPGPAGHVNGWMDDLRVYDQILTDDQIRALVPEPSSLLLGLLGVAGALQGGRRR